MIGAIRVFRRLALLVMCAVPLSALSAQGAVTGQVSLKEREGEQTEDLTDVIVWLEPTGAAKRLGATTATIRLKSRQFAPRVIAVSEGSKIQFPNEDSFSHNVFSKAQNGAFDTGVYPRGRSHDQTFKEAGVFPIYCNIHPRMTGYVVVMNSPYFGQAGDDGRFTIPSVPAGAYTLHIWHDRAQESTQKVAVAAGGLPVGKVELDARGYKFVQHKNKFGQEYTNALGDRY